MARTATTPIQTPVLDVTAALTSAMIDDKTRQSLMRDHVRGIFNKGLAATPSFEQALVAVFMAGVATGQASLVTTKRKRKSRAAAAPANGTQTGEQQPSEPQS